MKRLALLALSALLLAAAGCQTDPGTDPETGKVLVIGNSFTFTATRYLPQLAVAASIPFDFAALTIGDASLSNHCANCRSNREPPNRVYRLDRFVRGHRFAKGTRADLIETLDSARWDVVILQQSIAESWRAETYEPFASKLVATVRQHAPLAKIYFQEPWSPTPWDPLVAQSGLSPDEMHLQIAAITRQVAASCKADVIPTGTAVALWRRRLPVRYTEKSFGGDVVGGRYQARRDLFDRDLDNRWVPNCDVRHLNEDGEYFQVLVWAAVLMDIDLDDAGDPPESLDADRVKLMREIAEELGRRQG